MKKIISLAALVIALSLTSCFSEYMYYILEEEPIVPDTYDGKSVDVQGTVYINGHKVNMNIWNATTNEDKLVTIVISGNDILSHHTVNAEKYSTEVTLPHKGYNYIIMKAEKEGASQESNITVSFDDGNDEYQFTLSATAQVCGAYNIYVQ